MKYPVKHLVDLVLEAIKQPRPINLPIYIVTRKGWVRVHVTKFE